MARLYTEGFELPNDATTIAKDTIFKTVVSPTIAAGVSSPFALRFFGTTNAYVACTFPTTYTELYFRTYYMIGTDAGHNVLTLLDNVGNQVGGLYRVSVNTLQLRNTSANIVATAPAPNLSMEAMLELYVKKHASAGVMTLRIDGVEVATWTGDTITGSYATINGFRLSSPTSSVSATHDNIAVNDTTGSTDNSWPGAGIVRALRPNGAGDSTDWTPSVGSNWQNVDERPIVDTDYNSSSTSGHKDLYNLETYAVPAGYRVGRVWVTARVLDPAAAGQQVQLGIKSGGTEHWSANPVTPPVSSSSYNSQEWKTDPTTGLNWTQSALDALQAGVKVV